MNKPWIIWSLSALCAVLVFGAMGVITRHTLGLEKGQAEAEARAELEERIRLSLWRMDATAAGLLAEENNRPAWHFRDVDLQNSIPLTPLNRFVPPNVKLHFEVSGNKMSTPQVNDWDAVDKFVNNGQLQVQEAVEISSKKVEEWDELQNLMQGDEFDFEGAESDFGGGESDFGFEQVREVDSLSNNLTVIGQIADLPEPVILDEKLDEIVVAKAVEQRANWSDDKVASKENRQLDYNQVEKSKRAAIIQKQSNAWSAKNDLVKEVSKKKESKKVSKRSFDKKKPSKAQEAEKLQPKDDEQEVVIREESATVKVIAETYLSVLRPIWLGENLILVRDVQGADDKKLQGVWLDTESLQKSLLANISDLLPSAKLEPVRQKLSVILGDEVSTDAEDPMVMAALPWKLIPGEIAVAAPVGWTPMRKTLGLAWVGAVLAAVAAVVLLRGVVKLSERRASFVSSVTHELRTPLTTFSLYSEMLADGMIRDEEKQKEYLNTLRKESSRLAHLVENVLAYSRIERGSARAKVETVRVSDFVDRISGRLSSRAEEARMKLCQEIAPEVGERKINVDTTAVEQILFNLVDNASKYASESSADGMIKLQVLELSKKISFRVCDQGPGIKKSERRKLFRAFHKSAQEAAHTKPGVGLGLALCRRLAHALGGELRILDQEKGACFELTLSK